MKNEEIQNELENLNDKNNNFINNEVQKVRIDCPSSSNQYILPRVIDKTIESDLNQEPIMIYDDISESFYRPLLEKKFYKYKGKLYEINNDGREIINPTYPFTTEFEMKLNQLIRRGYLQKNEIENEKKNKDLKNKERTNKTANELFQSSTQNLRLKTLNNFYI